MSPKKSSPGNGEGQNDSRYQFNNSTFTSMGKMTIGNEYNFYDQRIANVQTIPQFVEVLAQLKAEIAALKSQPQIEASQSAMIVLAEEQVEQAIQQANEPQPVGARIVATLTSAKAMMDQISGALQSAVGLGATLAGLIQIAMKVFGG